MSIKHFSKSEFIDTVKDILKNEKFLGIRGSDKIDEKSSFREVLDITSLDIAELIIAIEGKYHVDMEWAPINNIDNIDDTYNAFTKSIQIARRSTAMNHSNPKQKIKHQDYVFETVKSIILDVCDEKANKEIKESDITKDCSLRDDLGLDELDNIQIAMAFEKINGIPYMDDNIIENIKTMKDLCDVLKAYLYGNHAFIKEYEAKMKSSWAYRIKQFFQNSNKGR